MRFNFVRPSLRGDLGTKPSKARKGRQDRFAAPVIIGAPLPPSHPVRSIALRASDRPISTKAEVTSGPPTKMRVGVFILFHS
jgi:hypothetical protein